MAESNISSSRKRKRDYDPDEQDKHDKKCGIIHRTITNKVVLLSTIVNVFVGEETRPFRLHKDLLTLHSNYFVNGLREAEEDKILINTTPACFADFVGWMYNGKIFKTEGPGSQLSYLWALGSLLEAPAFQNVCMDLCRLYYCEYGPCVSMVELAYEITEKGSLLRKFAADSMFYLDIFDKYEEGSPDLIQWKELLEKYHDLSLLVASGSRNKWSGTAPWDLEHRADYMELETDLEQRWEEQILAKRSREDIQGAAGKKEYCSMVELAHLDRMQRARTESLRREDAGHDGSALF